MTKPYVETRTPDEVFVDAVRDRLEDRPNASHPVQFEVINDVIAACTLCGSAVPRGLRWQDQHRSGHDAHNQAHHKLAEQARDAAAYSHPKLYR